MHVSWPEPPERRVCGSHSLTERQGRLGEDPGPTLRGPPALPCGPAPRQGPSCRLRLQRRGRGSTRTCSGNSGGDGRTTPSLPAQTGGSGTQTGPRPADQPPASVHGAGPPGLSQERLQTQEQGYRYPSTPHPQFSASEAKGERESQAARTNSSQPCCLPTSDPSTTCLPAGPGPTATEPGRRLWAPHSAQKRREMI